MWSLVGRSSRNLVQTAARASITQARCMSLTIQRKSEEPIYTSEERQAAWLEYFGDENVDFFEIRTGLVELLSDDIIPDPEVSRAIVLACRKVNNVPAALRFLEVLKFRCQSPETQELYYIIMEAIQPTLDEIGLPTPTDLGLDIVSIDLEF
jgi:cytochrome c oxidase subunit 5a